MIEDTMTLLSLLGRIMRYFLLRPETLFLLCISLALWSYFFHTDEVKTIVKSSRDAVKMVKGKVAEIMQNDRLGGLDVLDAEFSKTWEFKSHNVAVYSIQGRRDHMEDRFEVITDLVNKTHPSIFGIFDGHGGEESARLGKKPKQQPPKKKMADPFDAQNRVPSGIGRELWKSRKMGSHQLEVAPGGVSVSRTWPSVTKLMENKRWDGNNSVEKIQMESAAAGNKNPNKKPTGFFHPEGKTTGGSVEIWRRQSLVNPPQSAAEYVKSRLPEVLKQHLQDYEKDKENSVLSYQTILEQQILSIDREMLEKLTVSYDEAGTTCLIALLSDKELTVANVGDSRGVLCDKDGNAIPLSHDHKPYQLKERKRIKRAGGFISFNGSWRVQGILAMSRSLGDYPLKNLNVVIPDPDILTFDLDKLQPEFMILASDGLWDAFSNEEAVRFIKERLDEPHFGAKSIVLQSFYRGCPDNITVMVVKFRNSSKAEEQQ
ncbi:hypothetical protein WISP_22815 [Willisornis vidua]|uniref:PPM-type phosphatase domain-containing protein n=1 Tax=Willisornis vidua TaxID=1566151 RepID=A0ABQ9DP43_9PASS|nr:hypothetical protein WISP_22815 [Willisornis vidua]